MHEHCNQWQGFRQPQPDGWLCKVKNSMAEQETICWNRPTQIAGEGEVYNVRICIETQTHEHHWSRPKLSNAKHLTDLGLPRHVLSVVLKHLPAWCCIPKTKHKLKQRKHRKPIKKRKKQHHLWSFNSFSRFAKTNRKEIVNKSQRFKKGIKRLGINRA